MTDNVDLQLSDETAAWCRRAQQAMEQAPGSWQECIALVREGILLRRRWDRIDPAAAARGGLLTTLAAAQSVCQRELSGCVPDGQQPEAKLVKCAIDELAEDDRYLVGLLEDETLAPETVAFAVECFRDDLHWLGTQVALLDGAQGIDFLGRILLEQEALQREIDVWEDQLATSTGKTRDGRSEAAAEDASQAPAGDKLPRGAPTPKTSEGTTPPMPEELRRAAGRLRATTLGRRIEALLGQPEPQDWPAWHRAWRAASHLATQIEPTTTVKGPKPGPGAEAAGPLDARTCQRLEQYRARAAGRWTDCLDDLSAEERRAALEKVGGDLQDLASESLTFLEDLPLDRAARSLEVLSDDLGRCLAAVRRHWNSGLRGLWRSLRWRRRRVEAELQERRLGWRMEGIFGHRAVTLWERLILILLLLFVGMLAVELTMVEELSPHATEVELTVVVLAWADLGICVVFLTDFLLRLWLAQRRWLYFWHNWITGLLPAIPFGFISLYALHATAMAEAGEGFVLLRALRYLRLPRMARWLRIARPAVRLFRLVGFALRASDRLMRQLGPLVNRNLVLFERAAIRVEEPRYRRAMAALRERFDYRAAEVFTLLPEAARWRLVKARIDDLAAMLDAPQSSLMAPAPAEQTHAAREIPLDRVIARLLVATPAGISDRIGRRLARSVARWCRAFDVVGVRRLPLVRDLVAAGRLGSPYETTARVANRIGMLLKGLMDRVYWMADLYGTVTAPQLVDSIGETMVKGTARPARRLILFGAAFLAVLYLANLLPFQALKDLSKTLREFIGAPLVVLGVLCLIPMCLGIWFRRIAGEATDFYSRVAEAQFIAATKQLKGRLAKRQHAMLRRRVIVPELELAEGAAPADSDPGGAAARGPGSPAGEAEESRAAVELLWDDYLDGAPFHRSDTKTTTQLLGNLALVSLRQTRLAYGRRERKRLARLDLANARTSVRGPYLWFNFISRSLAQQTAKLVVDYNAHALPVCRFQSADDELVVRYVRWLSRRLGKPVDRLDLAPELAARIDVESLGAEDAASQKERLRSGAFQGNHFTAIHFLSADPAIQEDVRRRYGETVAEMLRTDRRDNIHRVFRTYPFHRRPKEKRTVNPMTLYERHLAGGRVLIFPLKLLGLGVLLALQGIGLVWRIVREVLQPAVTEGAGLGESDPYAVAVRKIHRMRGPVFMECLRMRAEFDPEYLGVLLPGATAAGGTTAVAPIEEDLARIAAEPGDCEEFRQLAARRRRQVLQLRRWLARFDLGQLAGRSLRALAIAYTLDYQGMRGALEAAYQLERTFDEAAADPSRAAAEGRGWSPRAVACRLRYRRRMQWLFEQPAFARFDAPGRRVCCRIVYCRRGPLLAAVRRLTPARGTDRAENARQRMLAVARDPAVWTRQLVVLRAVQTLSVLDLETYCELAAELGEYDDSTRQEGVRDE